MAMPRGSGKTSLCETACLWAMLYGHRDFVALIGSDEEHAAQMLDSIKAELENNDRLLDDFRRNDSDGADGDGDHGGRASRGLLVLRHLRWLRTSSDLPRETPSPNVRNLTDTTSPR